MSLPKIIHQLWIGSKKPPVQLMNTWRDKHPDYTYIYWNETEFEKRGFKSQLQDRIDEMSEINGKADILRWEILYEYGGIFIDADAICIEKLDPLFKLNSAFASYENEQIRGQNWTEKFVKRFDINKCQSYKDLFTSANPLIATGTMAFPKNHELPQLAIDWIRQNSLKDKIAWITVGPGLLTRLYYSKSWENFKILPSHYFLPFHNSGLQIYHGHEKIYAHQKWGSSQLSYDTMDTTLPQSLCPPTENVSILVSSYNTHIEYIKECLESIKHQVGQFHIELVWINDGSTPENTQMLKQELNHFIENTRFTSLIYDENDTNKGIGYSLNKGIKVCSNEIIIKMDSDDIMVNDRIKRQLELMKSNPEIHVTGGQLSMFRDTTTNIVGKTNFKTITFDHFKKHKPHWFVNHPTLCYRKSSILSVGNYNSNYHRMMEDFDLELRLLKKYGQIHQTSDLLLYYRLHPGQVTHNGGSPNVDWYARRNELIKNILS